MSKANGPDNVSNRLLKETALSISYSLARLFNISLQRGEFPKLWKLAHVVPVHKKESTQDPLNYRPVSLLSCISKIFEKLVFNHVYQYLDHFHLLSPKQSGFRPGDSTVNQLCFITHRIYESLQNGKEVRAVFIDLQSSSLNAGPRPMPGKRKAGPVIYSFHLPKMSDNSSGWHLTCHLNFQWERAKQSRTAVNI